MKPKLEGIADFLFEAGMLARTPRSGFFFLGSGEQSVAEHTNRVSDLNYVYQKYNDRKEDMAVHDLAEEFVFGKNIEAIVREYEERKSIEALIVKDADNLEFILSLKEQIDIGNAKAKTWVPNIVKRLKTAEAKQIAKTVMKTSSDNWWFKGSNSSWWISRKK